MPFSLAHSAESRFSGQKTPYLSVSSLALSQACFLSYSLALWLPGSLFGSLALWLSGSLALWLSGTLALWLSGSLWYSLWHSISLSFSPPLSLWLTRPLFGSERRCCAVILYPTLPKRCLQVPRYLSTSSPPGTCFQQQKGLQGETLQVGLWVSSIKSERSIPRSSWIRIKDQDLVPDPCFQNPDIRIQSSIVISTEWRSASPIQPMLVKDAMLISKFMHSLNPSLLIGWLVLILWLFQTFPKQCNQQYLIVLWHFNILIILNLYPACAIIQFNIT